MGERTAASTKGRSKRRRPKPLGETGQVIVLDASAVLEVLLQTPRGRELAKRVLTRDEHPAAPHLLDVEVAQVLRRYAAGGEMDERRAREAMDDLADMPIERYAHGLLLPRAWELRGNLTIYDAVYVALAELLGATLVTCDRRLAKSGRIAAKVELL